MKTMPARTKRKSGPAKKQNSRTFTSQETDTIIAALRHWQANVDVSFPYIDEQIRAQIEIASEHGEPLSDSKIDDLIEKINR